MAKTRNGVNKSAEIRHLLKANPEIGAKEVVAKFAEKGIKISDALFYFVKGQMRGRKARKTKARKMVARVAVTTGTVDALATILKIKHLASEVGGLKKLRALVEALSE
jgi:hypothetical protein